MQTPLTRRPTLLVAASLTAGLVAPEFWPAAGLVILAVYSASSLGWRFAQLGFFILGLAIAPEKVPQVAEILPFQATATVASIPDVSARGQSLIVQTGNAQFSLYSRDSAILAPGDLVAIDGTLGPLFDGPMADRDERTLSGHIRTELGGVRVLQQGPMLFRIGTAWRARFVAFVRRTTIPEAAAVINALCFNVTGDLDSNTYQNLQKTGTIHIVSASGLHVLIFAAGLSALLAWAPIPRGARLAVIFGILCVYAVGAGMKPPVVRSVAMAAILGAATLLRREPDLLSALGGTATAYLVWRPAAIYDLGFQFSFVTVAALGMFLRAPDTLPTQPLKRMGFGAAEVAKASFVACAASLPLSAYYFGSVSIVSIPANLLIAAALPFVTITAFAAEFLSVTVPALAGGLMAYGVQPLAGWILWVAESLGNLSFSTLSIPAFDALWTLPFYAAMILVWRPRARPI